MEKTEKFTLPSPCFDKPQVKPKPSNLPHFLSPQGMQLPRELQPPPMYGPRGSTVPPRFLSKHYKQNKFANDKRNNSQEKFQRKKPAVCENCDIEFKSPEELKLHISEHKICGIDGCKFFGYPKIVDMHIEQQHKSGLYDKIKNLTTPEDIEKWRAERRKRYPTRANIELRQKAKEERKKRGEMLESNKNRFGKQSDRRQMPMENQKTNRNDKRKRKRNRNRKDNANKQTEDKTTESETTENKTPENKNKRKTTVKTQTPIADENTNDTVTVFRGTINLPDYRQLKVKKIETTNALSSLVGMYGSDDEESTEDETEPDVDTNHVEINLKGSAILSISCEKETDPMVDTNHIQTVSNESSTVSTNFEGTDKNCFKNNNAVSNTDSKNVQLSEELALNRNADMNEEEDSDQGGPEEMAICRTTDLPETILKRPPPKKSNNKLKSKVLPKSGLDYSKLRRRRQNTMLEKLLAVDIRHERNILLQCTRFVVENNFFGIGQDS